MPLVVSARQIAARHLVAKNVCGLNEEVASIGVHTMRKPQVHENR